MDEQNKVKKLMEDYQDFGLVVAQDNGRPYEEHVIRKGFTKLIKKSKLPPVVFHSLRHTSTTYKLKLNNGDIKSVQGNTGHSQVNMVTDVYSHILDGDRRQNAQRFEQSLYKPKNEKNASASDVQKLAETLSENPELTQMLIGFLSKKGS
jgi:integrase